MAIIRLSGAYGAYVYLDISVHHALQYSHGHVVVGTSHSNATVVYYLTKKGLGESGVLSYKSSLVHSAFTVCSEASNRNSRKPKIECNWLSALKLFHGKLKTICP